MRVSDVTSAGSSTRSSVGRATWRPPSPSPPLSSRSRGSSSLVLSPGRSRSDEGIAAAGTAAGLSQEDLFGKSGDEVERTVEEVTGDERIDSLSATVTRLHQFNYDRVLITLDNGQVWKQVDSSSLRLRVGDAVDIERASLGSFMLRKKGSKRSMRVSRED